MEIVYLHFEPIFCPLSTFPYIFFFSGMATIATTVTNTPATDQSTNSGGYGNPKIYVQDGVVRHISHGHIKDLPLSSI